MRVITENCLIGVKEKIINLLHKLKFNVYFYAPKEDICHRFKWRKNYSKAWSNSFRNFCRYAKSLDIKVIAGISPGLDFDFTYNNNDLNILKNKL